MSRYSAAAPVSANETKYSPGIPPGCSTSRSALGPPAVAGCLDRLGEGEVEALGPWQRGSRESSGQRPEQLAPAKQDGGGGYEDDAEPHRGETHRHGRVIGDATEDEEARNEGGHHRHKGEHEG